MPEIDPVEHPRGAGVPNDAVTDQESNLPRAWMSRLGVAELDVWGQTLAHVRDSYNAVWSTIRLFFTVEGLVVTVMGLVGRQAEYVQDGLAVGAMALIGLSITGVGLCLLHMQWATYTGALLRKTLIEKELGFYDVRVGGIDLSLPWKVEARDGTLEGLLRDPQVWYHRHERRNVQLLLLTLLYLIVMVVYVTALGLVIAGFVSGYFFEKST
jgi:hypothetical protein